jgi:hypothetical protein
MYPSLCSIQFEWNSVMGLRQSNSWRIHGKLAASHRELLRRTFHMKKWDTMPAEELYRAQIQIPHLYSSNLFFYRSINYVVLSSYPRPSLILFFFALLSHVAFLFLATALSIQPAREPCSLGRRLIRIGQRTCSHMPYETRNSFRDSFNKRRYRETRCNHVIYLPFSLDCKTQ